jgi:hypothetical protein
MLTYRINAHLFVPVHCVGLMGGLVFVTAFVHVYYIIRVTETIALMQQVAVLTQSVAIEFPSSAEWLSTFISLFGALNWDLYIIKPGCDVPILNFVSVFLLTVGVIVFSLSMSIVMCWVVGTIRKQSQDVWAARIKVVVLAYCRLTFMRIMYMAFGVINCVDMDGTDRMLIDRTVVCYSEEHTNGALFAFCLILLMGVVYPAASYVDACERVCMCVCGCDYCSICIISIFYALLLRPFA